MKKKLVAALILGAIVCALAIPTFVSAARVRATITVDNSTAAALSTDGAQTVGFNVDADVSKASDLYKLWVANKCYADGTLISAEYLPVHDGYAGTFSVVSGWDCTAYVWLFPASESPIRGASVDYHVD